MADPATDLVVTRCSDLGAEAVSQLLRRYDVALEWQSAGSPIRGSFWGEPEAGIVGQRIFVRPDTPVHSMLHELCHIICHQVLLVRRRIDPTLKGLLR